MTNFTNDLPSIISEIDGERIAYLAKNAAYKSAADKPEDTGNLDDYVLKQLFKKSGKIQQLEMLKITTSFNK